MRWVFAVVRPFQVPDVLRELRSFHVEALEVSEARGYGRQKGLLKRYRGSEYSAVYLPKIEIRFLVREDLMDAVTQRIVAVARTGRIGDGKIFAVPVLGAVDL
jgi:nitrogen regulatory protein PII